MRTLFDADIVNADGVLAVQEFNAPRNLTAVNYPVSPDLSFAYDAANRLTNRVDGLGRPATVPPPPGCWRGKTARERTTW
ncbi:MAG TPA: hypothetical protein VNO52_07905 [Methylomirabilota bacterium]|nr:hypothetical protein [Methylomirabilota bacterium]